MGKNIYTLLLKYSECLAFVWGIILEVVLPGIFKFYVHKSTKVENTKPLKNIEIP